MDRRRLPRLVACARIRLARLYRLAVSTPDRALDAVLGVVRRISGCERSVRTAVSASTGEVYVLPCKSWLCSYCAPRRARHHRGRIESGIWTASQHHVVRHIVLTGGRTGLNLEQAWALWARLRRSLKEAGLLEGWVLVGHLDAHRPGVHIHVVAQTSASTTRLRELAMRAGFAWTHSKLVEPTREDAARLAIYLTRHLARDGHKFKSASGRSNPVRYGHAWPARTG